jgi:RNA polymerase sigma-70 factor (ECF subfamily)
MHSTGQNTFSTTRWGDFFALTASGEDANAALERICRRYWLPVYSYIRQRGHSPEDAADATQAFFLRLLSRAEFTRLDAGRGKFRSWLLVCLRRFLVDEWRSANGTVRRPAGGWLSINAAEGEARLAAEMISAESAEQAYNRRWAITLVEEVLNRLEHECTASGLRPVFEHLVAHGLSDPDSLSHAEAAKKLAKDEGSLKNQLTRLRKRFRALLLERIAETVADPAEVDQELRQLLSAFQAQ